MGRDWEPNWLSLDQAIVWVNTRDAGMTETADITESSLRRTRTKGATQVVSAFGQWRSIVRSIADGSISAEGDYMVFDGDSEGTGVLRHEHGKVLTAGEANGLVLNCSIPALFGKPALTSKSNGRVYPEGKIWHGIRLRARDVFKKYPKPSRVKC